jgi:uncharacterized membrane protein (DUF4010 family)
MTLPEIVISAAVAVAAGGLIGAERQQAQAEEKKGDFGGIRTFPLVALAGACASLLRPAVGAWAFGALFAGVVTALAISHLRSESKDVGVTSEVAAIVTFALGALATSPEVLPNGPRYLLVAALAATTMALLALKHPLHGFIARVSEDDVLATAKFVLLSLVVIPVLPNRTYGPLDVINPFKIGLFTALVAAISFAGYVAVRLFGGRRGMILTGLFGGLASSTAVTLTFAGRAKEQDKLVGLSAIAIVAASSVMFARVLVLVGVRDRPLLAHIAGPVGVMALAGAVGAVFLYRTEASHGPPAQPVSFRNPFELRSALQFGVIYIVVLIVSKAAQVYVGKAGVYASAVLAGVADVDAITLSLSELHLEGMPANVTAMGITLAAVTNTVVKIGMAVIVGGWQLGKRVGLVMLIALALGGLILAIA